MKKKYTLAAVFISLLPVSNSLFAKKIGYLSAKNKGSISLLLSTISSAFSPSFGMESLMLDQDITSKALCATNDTTGGGGGGTGGVCSSE
ncbi:MAG: hypothetical protein AB8G05_09680 [Oligoflexales bacterium]